METTTLEEAVESITAPEPEVSGDNNLSEAADAIVLATGDNQTDAKDETEEGEDDALDVGDELDEIQLKDDQIDDEDHVETEIEDTNTFTVKVDGKEENWTLDQLKQSAAGQAAINKRFQENSAIRNELDQQKREIEAQQAHVMQLYQHAQNGGFQAPVAPSLELSESDPVGYMQEKAAYDHAMVNYNAGQQEIQRIQQEQSHKQAQAHQEYLTEQMEVLRQHVPDFVDPEKGAKVKADLIALGGDYGFTPDEMGNVSDARYIRALYDARQYRNLVENRKLAAKKSEKARPVVKSGVKKGGNNSVQNTRKAQQRLQETGSIDDAMNLILNQ